MLLHLRLFNRPAHQVDDNNAFVLALDFLVARVFDIMGYTEVNRYHAALHC